MTVSKGTRRAKRRSSVASVCPAAPAEIDVPGTAIEGDGVELDGSFISSPQALRKRAEAIARLDQTQHLYQSESYSPEAAQRAIYELRIHQIELEMQNEELRRSQAELVTSQARYFDFYDMAPVGYCAVDESGLILQANLTTAALLGIARNALLRQSITRFILAKDQDSYFLMRQRIIGATEPQSCELRMMKVDGTPFWARLEALAVQNEGGAPILRIVMSDISERKQAETALQEQKNFLATILENEPECVKVLGADGKVLQMNNAGLSMLEVNNVEAVNACGGMANFVLPEHRAAFTDLIRRVFGGETGVLEFQVQGKQGTRRWLETHAAPLRDAAGKITYLLGVTRDVSRKREAEHRLSLSLRGADLALTDWHIPSDVLVFGEGWTKLLGYQPQELHPHLSTLTRLVNPEDALAIRNALIRHFKGETPFLEVEARLRHNDGRWIWVLLRGMAVERTADGRALRLAGTVMDITARKQAEAEIARLSQWIELILNSAGDGIYGVDRNGACNFANPAALAILGFNKEELLGHRQHQLFHHHHEDGSVYPEEDCPIYLTLRDGIQRKVDDAFIRKNGEVFAVQLTVAPMHENGQIVGGAVVFQDIAGRKAMEQELKRLATTDPLTGLANRRHFIEHLEMELARSKRSGESAAFLMVDIDHFKNINDTYGHGIGDAVLRHLAELSRRRLRRIDLFGRLGGEEFGILLPGTDGAKALQFAEDFRRHTADTPAQSSKGMIPFTISIGVAEFGPSDSASDSILARADAALYRAKESGRNRVEVG